MRTLWVLSAVLLAGCLGSAPQSAGGLTLVDLGVDGDPFLGDPEAPVQVVAFEAPACSVCKRFHHEDWPDLRADFVDTGRIGWHQQQWTIGFAYDDRGNVAMECAHREGGDAASWPFLDLIYSGPAYSGLSDEELRQGLRDTAAEHGLDEESLLACYEGQETLDEVEADIQAGTDNGGRGSPVFFVLGPDGAERVSRVDDLRGAIEAALAA